MKVLLCRTVYSPLPHPQQSSALVKQACIIAPRALRCSGYCPHGFSSRVSPQGTGREDRNGTLALFPALTAKAQMQPGRADSEPRTSTVHAAQRRAKQSLSYALPYNTLRQYYTYILRTTPTGYSNTNYMILSFPIGSSLQSASEVNFTKMACGGLAYKL